jgi:hypothetical protein
MHPSRARKEALPAWSVVFFNGVPGDLQPTNGDENVQGPSEFFFRAGRVGERATAFGCVSLPPRRTGDADFPRPALLKTLVSGIHSSRIGGPRQTDQPDPLEEPRPRDPLRRTEWSLTAPLQMLDESAPHVTVDLPVHARRVSKRKVVCPAFQAPVQFVYQSGIGL